MIESCRSWLDQTAPPPLTASACPATDWRTPPISTTRRCPHERHIWSGPAHLGAAWVRPDLVRDLSFLCQISFL
jgi:hypothetical protein